MIDPTHLNKMKPIFETYFSCHVNMHKFLRATISYNDFNLGQKITWKQSGRTIVKIHCNTQALSFGKNALKMINILPKLSSPLMVNSGYLSLFVSLTCSTHITSGKCSKNVCSMGGTYARPIKNTLMVFNTKTLSV